MAKRTRLWALPALLCLADLRLLPGLVLFSVTALLDLLLFRLLRQA